MKLNEMGMPVCVCVCVCVPYTESNCLTVS